MGKLNFLEKLKFMWRGKKLAKAGTEFEKAKILAKEKLEKKDLEGYVSQLKILKEGKAKAKQSFLTLKNILGGGIIAGISAPVGAYLSNPPTPPSVKTTELPKVPPPSNLAHLKEKYDEDWDDMLLAFQEGRADAIRFLNIRQGHVSPESFGFDPYTRKLNISLERWIDMGGSTMSYAEAEERLSKGVVGIPMGDEMYYTPIAKPSFWDVVTGKSQEMYKELSKPVNKKLEEFSGTKKSVISTINIFSYISIVLLVFILLTSTGVLKAR